MIKIVKKTSNKNKFRPLFLPIVILLTCIISVLSYYVFFLPNTDSGKSDNTFDQFSMGSPVNTGDMEVTVIGAFRGEEIYRYPGPFIDYCRARNGEIVVIEITVKNVSDRPITVDHFPIVDTLNRIFKSTNNIYSCIKSTHVMWFPRDINPGMDTSFVSIYEIPNDKSVEYSIRVSDDKLVELDFE